MNKITLRCGALALAGLFLVACKDKHEPLKPTVATHVATASVPAR